MLGALILGATSMRRANVPKPDIGTRPPFRVAGIGNQLGNPFGNLFRNPFGNDPLLTSR